MRFCKPTTTANVINDIFLKGRIVNAEYDDREVLAVILQNFQEQGFVLGCVGLHGELIKEWGAKDVRKIAHYNVLKIPTIHHKNPMLRQQIKQVLLDLHEGKQIVFDGYELKRQRLVELIATERKLLILRNNGTIATMRNKGRIIGYQKSVFKEQKRA